MYPKWPYIRWPNNRDRGSKLTIYAGSQCHFPGIPISFPRDVEGPRGPRVGRRHFDGIFPDPEYCGARNLPYIQNRTLPTRIPNPIPMYFPPERSCLCSTCTGWPISSWTLVWLTWIWDVPQAVGLPKQDLYTQYWYKWDSLNGTLDKNGHGTWDNVYWVTKN